MLWRRLVEGLLGGCSGRIWEGVLETGRGKWSGAWSREVAWQAGHRKRLGGRSTGIVWRLLKEWSGSWSGKLVSKLVEGSGLEAGAGMWSWNPEKLEPGSVR